jgi:hypothetical protein
LMPLQADNLPAYGLKNLFKFLETTYTAGVQDGVTGVMYSIDGATPDANNISNPASGGGGVTIKGWRFVAGPTIDITKAFTVLVGHTAVFAAANNNQGIMAIGDVGGKGLWFFDGIETGKPFANGSFHGVYGQSFESGVAVGKQVLPPWVAVTGSYHTLFVSHDGLGNYTVGRCKGGRFDKAGMNIVPSTLINGGSANQPFRIGGVSENTILGTLTIEAGVAYDRELDQSEILQAHTALLAIATARGRS